MDLVATSTGIAQGPFALRRVTALVGPYGSGKTELAIGLSLLAARQVGQEGSAVRRAVLGDLDVLKPYFRSREVSDSLKQSGVGLLAPAGALAQSDLPILTPELRGSVLRQDTQVVLDVGGDPVGARALGSISDVMNQSGGYDLLLVLNRYRPFMDTQEKVVEQARRIAAAANLDFTGVISNTNLLEETSEQDVEWGLELAVPVAQELGVAVRLLAVSEHLEESFAHRTGLPPVVAIRRRMMPHFLGGVVLAPTSRQIQGPRPAPLAG
ncbi:MAG: hypothetical protein HY901_00055 [Deltaproteobacteria bacterium]|nr:hypothetical protein [Deltaproteobacteria bacterium]